MIASRQETVIPRFLEPLVRTQGLISERESDTLGQSKIIETGRAASTAESKASSHSPRGARFIRFLLCKQSPSGTRIIKVACFASLADLFTSSPVTVLTVFSKIDRKYLRSTSVLHQIGIRTSFLGLLEAEILKISAVSSFPE
ncbi:hypothetical protein KFK09_024806 [Dendrobium nobile]|uniref:Uncharacterized protein n=1 Tax=Dendrobium nobile TaxID=94219 RepID=A0A8T3AF31_DENNO|nr:hypothetical protein KFK09_024806 [Dendrobium nobile]